MGLEAINFFFRSEEEIEKTIGLHENIVHIDERKYVYKKENDYWIDIEFQDPHSISLRITLSNPRIPVLEALYELLSILFGLKGGVLTDMNTKQVYKTYDNELKKAVERSYISRRKVFEEMYGNYTAAISSEEFYERQRERNQS